MSYEFELEQDDVAQPLDGDRPGPLTWRPSVATLAALQALDAEENNPGDARVVRATNALYVWNTSSQTWNAVAGEGGGDVSSVFGRTGAVVADAADYAAHYQPLDADLTALAALGTTGIARRTGAGTWSVGSLVTYAELQQVSATDKVLGRSTAGAGVVEEIPCTSTGRSVLAIGSLALLRALLGVPEPVLLSGDVSESSAVEAAVADLQFTPVAGGVYEIEVGGVFTAAAATTGLRFRIDLGNGVAGAADLRTRGSSNTTAAVHIGNADTTLVLGVSAATSGETPWSGKATITAHASAPTAIQVYFSSEVVGSAVTLKGGKCTLKYRRVS